MSTPSYNPPSTPNVIMNFTGKGLYNPQSTPNIIMNFGASGSGGSSGSGNGTVMSNFFLVM